MSTNFGTTSLPTVFKPTGATPIDVRTYFESYASALEAARIAAVAGDSNVIYYFGQILTVYEPTPCYPVDGKACPNSRNKFFHQ